MPELQLLRCKFFTSNCQVACCDIVAETNTASAPLFPFHDPPLQAQLQNDEIVPYLIFSELLDWSYAFSTVARCDFVVHWWVVRQNRPMKSPLWLWSNAMLLVQAKSGQAKIKLTVDIQAGKLMAIKPTKSILNDNNVFSHDKSAISLYIHLYSPVGRSIHNVKRNSNQKIRKILTNNSILTNNLV